MFIHMVEYLPLLWNSASCNFPCEVQDTCVHPSLALLFLKCPELFVLKYMVQTAPWELERTCATQGKGYKIGEEKNENFQFGSD